MPVKPIGSILGAAALILTASVAEAQQTSTANTDGTTSNGSSTGVGNAGSFGIGSGTSDSLSTATAISNGITDSSTTITTVSVQDLQASNTGSQLFIVGSAIPDSPSMQSGNNAVSGGAFSGFAGILSNGWNTGPAAIAQAATSIAVNGNLGAR